MSSNTDIDKLLENAWDKRRVGKYREARFLVEKAQELIRDDDYNSFGRVFHIYMQFESDHNKLSKALEYCQQSLNFYRKANKLDKVAHSIRHLADLQRRLGKNSVAESNYREAIDIYRNNPQTDTGDLANALRGFALVLEQLNKITEAMSVWEEARELYHKCGIQAGVDEAEDKLESLRQ